MNFTKVLVPIRVTGELVRTASDQRGQLWDFPIGEAKIKMSYMTDRFSFELNRCNLESVLAMGLS